MTNNQKPPVKSQAAKNQRPKNLPPKNPKNNHPKNSQGARPEIQTAELDIHAVNRDGELQAKFVDWPHKSPPPRLILTGSKRHEVKKGDRVLARLVPATPTSWAAQVLQVLQQEVRQIVGVYQQTREGGRVLPTNRRVKSEVVIANKNRAGAEDGELVVVDLQPQRKLGLPEGKVIERIGTMSDPRAYSLISIHENDIPVSFTAAAEEQANAAQPAPLGMRTDLRALPLVTIDGEDARDFDDAVFAEPLAAGGWHIVVAIADVAHYVTPHSPLDKAAFERGNSVYFPDRVVPMLPEALSNELCSLKPNVDRATMAVHLYIDESGELQRYEFVRGLMRSTARLTYNQVQAALEGTLDVISERVFDPHIKNLHGAYQTLKRARVARGTLELDVPEFKAKISEAGKVVAIEKRRQQTAHMLIEELMILANVAAARALQNQPCMYRIHAPPPEDKRDALADFLGTLGAKLPKGQRLTPHGLQQIISRFADTPQAQLVNEMMLRSQSQATYSPDNVGHFGLALQEYAHFTSPIRRYADLLVHRALIKKYGFGADALPRDEATKLAEIGEHLSVTERRAAQAERDATARYISAFLADRVGAQFGASISGVAHFGIFVRLDDTGADGLIPTRSLAAAHARATGGKGDARGLYFTHDEAAQALVAQRGAIKYQLGQRLVVELAEANNLTGRLLFDVVLPAGAAGAKRNDQPKTAEREKRAVHHKNKRPRNKFRDLKDT